MENKEPISEGLINIIRSFTRPALTFFLTVHWAMLYWSIVDMGGGLGNIDTAYTMFVWGLILWWFGDRTLLKGNSLLNMLKGNKQE